MRKLSSTAFLNRDNSYGVTILSNQYSVTTHLAFVFSKPCDVTILFKFNNNPFSQSIYLSPRGFDLWSDRIQAFIKGSLPADLLTLDDLIRLLRAAKYLRSCSPSPAVAPAGEFRQLASELANWQMSSVQQN